MERHSKARRQSVPLLRLRREVRVDGQELRAANLASRELERGAEGLEALRAAVAEAGWLAGFDVKAIAAGELADFAAIGLARFRDADGATAPTSRTASTTAYAAITRFLTDRYASSACASGTSARVRKSSAGTMLVGRLPTWFGSHRPRWVFTERRWGSHRNPGSVPASAKKLTHHFHSPAQVLIFESLFILKTLLKLVLSA